MLFFFKQKTAYEMRISDWSSDVCSSDLRAKRNLLADQPKELLEEVVPFYTEGTKEGIFSTTGGGIEAAKADFDFYTEAGQMEGPASSLKVEDFWDLRPLDAAKQKLGL